MNAAVSAQEKDALLSHYSVEAAEGLADPALLARRRQAYVGALRTHDWFHELHGFDGELSKVFAGRAARARLMLEAADIDSDFVLWNENCPLQFKRGLQKADGFNPVIFRRIGGGLLDLGSTLPGTFEPEETLGDTEPGRLDPIGQAEKDLRMPRGWSFVAAVVVVLTIAASAAFPGPWF